MPIALQDIAGALPDRFRLEREIGSGGWAIVYRAEDLKLGRRVAIKILRPEVADQTGAQRFEREIEILARLVHPHLLPLLDSGLAAGSPYYVMPYVEGESLREKISREGPLQVREALRIGREVADALAYAHGQGVIHRDIKPGNIMMEAGHAVVTDFGIASLTHAISLESLTDTGTVPGTPHYMAPEQLEEGGEADERSDIYGLGCVLYEMLAGEPPISGSNAHVVMARKLAGEIPRLRIARRTVPESLESVVHQALERLPADRFQDAAELANALSSIRAEVPTVEEARLQPQRTFAQKAALWAAGLLAAVFGTAVIGFLSTTALDFKLQVPGDFTPTEPNHLLSGARALLPFFVLGFVALVAFLVLRPVGAQIGATLTRVPLLKGPVQALDTRVTTRVSRMLREARPNAVADGFLFSMIVVSILVLWPFGDLLSALWTSGTEVLECENRSHYHGFLVGMVLLISGFGGGWVRLFPWLERRTTMRRRLRFVRWTSFAWLVGLLLVLTVPWRLLNADADRIRIDGAPAYLLDQTETRYLVYIPTRGHAEVRERTGDVEIERLGRRGYPFEGSAAFDSGSPWCDSAEFNPEGGP